MKNYRNITYIPFTQLSLMLSSTITMVQLFTKQDINTDRTLLISLQTLPVFYQFSCYCFVFWFRLNSGSHTAHSCHVFLVSSNLGYFILILGESTGQLLYRLSLHLDLSDVSSLLDKLPAYF